MSLENQESTKETVTPPTVNSPTSTTSSETLTPTPAEKAQTSEKVEEVPAKETSSEVVEQLPEVAPSSEEEYELELSQDSPLSAEDLNEIATEAGRLNLSKEDAEKLIALKESAYKKGTSSVEEKYQQALWKNHDEMSKHPEFTGDAAAESWKYVNKAIAGFGSQELVELLKKPEYGNLVPVAQLLKKIGQAMAPDATPPEGKGVAGSPQVDPQKEALARQYPAFFKDNL